MFDLFHLYIEQFDNIIEKFYEIEKASSDVSLATESDDAQKLKITE
ncbi:TPA: pathogenicity island protein, partial [Staphylococcus aureus]|nr:pathogenicity island protein [Staphylococcus aureus]